MCRIVSVSSHSQVPGRSRFSNQLGQGTVSLVVRAHRLEVIGPNVHGRCCVLFGENGNPALSSPLGPTASRCDFQRECFLCLPRGSLLHERLLDDGFQEVVVKVEGLSLLEGLLQDALSSEEGRGQLGTPRGRPMTTRSPACALARTPSNSSLSSHPVGPLWKKMTCLLHLILSLMVFPTTARSFSSAFLTDWGVTTAVPVPSSLW